MVRRQAFLAILWSVFVAGCARQSAQTAGSAPADARLEGERSPARPAGSVWLWGIDPTTRGLDVPRLNRVPAPVEGMTGVVAVAVGRNHYLALMADGKVWDSNGRLESFDEGRPGPNGGYQLFVPGFMAGLEDVVAVSARDAHSLALEADGTVRAWGANHLGQLGTGTTEETYPPQPVRVKNLAGVAAIAAGSAHSLALGRDGTVWAWGSNAEGALGDGTKVDRHVPVQVRGLADVKAIAAGHDHSLALKTDGTMWAWGANYGGSLGDGTSERRTVPVPVLGMTNVAAVAAGVRYSLAAKTDGTVWTWGSLAYHDEGEPDPETGILPPVHVRELSDARLVAGGHDQSFVVRGDGTVWAWGDNRCCQLGDGTEQYRRTPVRVQGLTGVIAVAGGAYFSLALRAADR